jgi:LPPG:FO 2-phospho-L-lactate transferase
MLRELGHEASVVGVARMYRELASVLVIDDADASSADAVAAEGIECLVVPTVMSSPAIAAALAKSTLDAVA